MSSGKVLRTYFSLSFVFTLSASLIWGVNTLFLLDAGLDIFEVFIANAAFTAGMVVFEIPTGVVADTAGRRVSFLWSTVVLAVATVGYVALSEIEAGVLAFSAVSVLLGLGFTFYSGAVEAWVVDALAATGYAGEMDRVFARGGLAGGAAMLIGTVGGGFAGDVDLAIPFVLRAALLGVAFGVAWYGMKDLGFEPSAATSRIAALRDTAATGVAFGWRQPSVRLLMTSSAIRTGVGMWAFYAWQPHLLDLLEREAIWVAGVVAALVSLSTMLGNAIVEWTMRPCRYRTTLLIQASGVSAASLLGMGLTDVFGVALGFLLLASVAGGVITPVRQSYLHGLVPSRQRATVLSFDSMVGSAGGVGGQAGLGWVAQTTSLGAGYVTAGAVSLISVPVLVALRRRGDAEDRYQVGEPLATEGPPVCQQPAEREIGAPTTAPVEI